MGVIGEVLKQNAHDKNITAQKSKFEQMCDVSDVKTTDETFDAELQTYGEMDSVSIGSDVKTYYGQTNSIISQAVSSIKTASATMKAKLSALKSYQSSQQQSKTSMGDLNKQIREAKKKYNQTMPFSKEAKSAKEHYNNLRRQRAKTYLSQRKYRTKISEVQTELQEQADSVKQHRSKIEQATKKRDQIIAAVRKQFKIVDSIRAQYTFLKTVADLNSLSPDAQKQRKAFTDAFENKSNTLKISLLTPLKAQYTDKELSDSSVKLDPIVAASQKSKNALAGLKLPTMMPPGFKTIESGINETKKLLEAAVAQKVKQLENLKNGTLVLPDVEPTK